MEHRHLLPNEIDLLLDGDVGFGLTPLRAHVRRCAHCRAELEEARAVTAQLEHLPHLAPSPLFAERVMARVQIFEPAHVAALDTARRWLPRSRPARALAGAVAGSAALLLSVATLWIALRLDVVLFFTGLVAERGRGALVDALGGVVGAAVGQPALDALRSSGANGLLVALTAVLVAVVAAAVGLRAMAGAASRRRRAS